MANEINIGAARPQAQNVALDQLAKLSGDSTKAKEIVSKAMEILAGANVIMPNVTPVRYRGEYILYPGKPCTGESSELCRGCLERRVKSIGEEIAWGERCDPIHYREAHGSQRLPH